MISIIKISKTLHLPKSKKRGSDDIKLFCLDHGLDYKIVRDAYTLYVAHYFLYRFKKAVKEQKIGNTRMKSLYKPLNRNYRKSKPWGVRGKFWINSGELVKKLGIYIDKKNIVHVGFRGNPTYLNNKSKVEFKKVLKYMEYGTKKMRARPLIRPILSLVSKNTPWLWARFKKEILLTDSN